MPKDAYRYFRIEARELLDEMSKAALDLEKGQDTAGALSRLLRQAHTIKGAARVVKLPTLAEHAHALEEELVPIRDGAEAPSPAKVSAVLAHLDGMEQLLAALPSADAPTPAVAETAGSDPASAKAVEAPSLVPSLEVIHPARSGFDGLQAVLDGVTESHVLTASLTRQHEAITHARDLSELLLGQLAPRRATGGSSADRRMSLGAAHDLASELHTTLGTLSTSLSQTADLLMRELRQTRDIAEQLKLVPVQSLFTLLERTARDVARMQGKQVSFRAAGGEVRLDVGLIAAVQPALIQLVRNAVAHGIEPPDARQRAGKPELGEVSVTVRQHGRQVTFVCFDDGAGINAQAVAESARRKGLLHADATLDQETLVKLLLHGGLSTAAEVTEVSGRGIGLNVVADALSHWQGKMTLDTTAGKGTRLVLTFPMSLAALPTLGVMAQGTLAAIPLDAVVRTSRVTSTDIIRSAEGAVVLHDGEPVPFLPLATALRLQPDAPSHWSVVIIKGNRSLVALGVNRLLGVSHIVLRPIPAWSPELPLIAGLTLDVEGHPQMVLSPEGLIEAARTGAVVSERPPQRPDPLLVIDDSLTTRMLEQSILESAGYEVETATSAEDGLAKARERRHALFLVDVDMPGMDGFTFVQTVQADPALRDTPAILVTSRASQEDKDKGKAVGASDYIVKGDFAQNAFLDSVRRLTQSQ